MDLVDLLILALRLVLVGVLYLFLFIVVRAAWRGLRQSGAPPPVRRRAPPSMTPASAAVGVPATLHLLVLDAGASDLPTNEVIEVRAGDTLGRAARASVRIADAAVSGEHARLVRTPDAWRVVDLDSTNGTLLNQAPIHGEAPLTSGDVLSVGTVRLQVVAHPAAG